MFDFRLGRHSGTTLLRLMGSLQGGNDLDRLHESFAFVQPNDHLILDLTELDTIDDAAAATLHEILLARSALAESVVVSVQAEVSLQLVLHDLDRVCPIVRTVDEAVTILDSRWANRRHAH
jgi:anti-anti-sigma regulatory factor